jgi:phosphatidylinositol alpha-1,6-mannosyltransferase
MGSKFLNIPLVATVHGIDVFSRNFFHNFLIRSYLLFPKKIIAVSNYTASLAKLNTNENKVKVIFNGVDIDKLRVTQKKSEFIKKLGLKNNSILLSVAPLNDRKGIDLIIKVLPQVIKEVPNLMYLIVGDGERESYFKSIVKSLHLQNHVRFLGFIVSKELANYYNLCDVFALMSRTIEEKGGIEGFGIVYIEASYLGKPVIGGKSGGTGDAIIDKVTGYRVDPNNLQDLTKKLVLLLKNKDLRTRMGGKGQKFVEKGLLWKHNVIKTLEIYKEVIK